MARTGHAKVDQRQAAAEEYKARNIVRNNKNRAAKEARKLREQEMEAQKDSKDTESSDPYINENWLVHSCEWVNNGEDTPDFYFDKRRMSGQEFTDTAAVITNIPDGEFPQAKVIVGYVKRCDSKRSIITARLTYPKGMILPFRIWVKHEKFLLMTRELDKDGNPLNSWKEVRELQLGEFPEEFKQYIFPFYTRVQRKKMQAEREKTYATA